MQRYAPNDVTLLMVSLVIPLITMEKKCTKVLHLEENIRALQDTIYVIGGKWKLPIVHSICNGNKRFSDILRSIPGLTHRMLSRNLRELEDNKLITRSVDENFPGVVEYDFTAYATQYGLLINEMIEWGKSHKKMITGDRQTNHS
ncbi:winged helix-turn-helix transcriptional regulator [Chitinophaga agri]|nr:helix-turn-helix domain-containing protein [Chitinophaga agri]